MSNALYKLFSIFFSFLIFKEMLLSKALNCMFFSCINKNGYFVMETDTFGHIVV